MVPQAVELSPKWVSFSSVSSSVWEKSPCLVCQSKFYEESGRPIKIRRGSVKIYTDGTRKDSGGQPRWKPSEKSQGARRLYAYKYMTIRKQTVYT